MAELDFEPFSGEAFPGLEFYLSGDRDLITLNLIETATERHLPLISVARQGYIHRHSLPGDFTPIPPRDGGRIPLEGHSATPSRAPRATLAEPPRPARTREVTYHEVRLGPRGTQMRLRSDNDDNTVQLQAYAGFGWKTLATINGETGRLYRWCLGANTVRTLREAGFCMSRDGGIAVENPQRRRTQDPALNAAAHNDDEAPLYSPDTQRITAMTRADQLFALREELLRWTQFCTVNRDIIRRVADDVMHLDTTQRSLTQITDQLLSRYNEALVAPQPQAQGGGEGGPSPDDPTHREVRTIGTTAFRYNAPIPRDPLPEPADPNEDTVNPLAMPQTIPTTEALIDFSLNPSYLNHAIHVGVDSMAHIPCDHTARLVTFQRCYFDEGENVHANRGAWRRVRRTAPSDTAWGDNVVADEPLPWNRECLRLTLPGGDRWLLPAQQYDWGVLFHCLEVTPPVTPANPSSMPYFATLTTALLRRLRDACDQETRPIDPEAIPGIDMDAGDAEDEPDDGMF